MASSITVVGFDEITFPKKVEFGIKGGPSWNTTVIATASGFEQRNQNWENARRRYTATFKQLPGDPFNKFADVLNFWMARRGRLRGFRFRDPTDLTATSEVCVGFTDNALLVGDGVETQWQTARFYDDGVNPFRRIIKKPAIETGPNHDADDPLAQVFLDSGGGPVLQSRNPAGDYDFDDALGKITFNVAPPSGAVVTWTGRYDVPVRFDSDKLPTVLRQFDDFVINFSFVERRI